MEHAPTAMIVTVEPETVQTAEVVDAKVTGSAELAVAPTGNGAVPVGTLPSAPKVIVCGRAATEKLWMTFGAVE